MPYTGYMTKSAEELKAMVHAYEVTLADHNKRWESGERGAPLEASSKRVDMQFEEICNAVAENVSELIEALSKAGIELRHVSLVQQYKEPYHEYWAKVGEVGYVAKHIVVPGYPYRRNS